MPLSTQRISLDRRFPKEVLKGMLLPNLKWKPYPNATDREGWEKLPEELRTTLIGYGDDALKESWPNLTASLYRQFAEIGNRVNFEQSYFFRRDHLSVLVTAECCEGKGRFIPEIMNAVWGICEESSWCLPAHIGSQRSGIDLPDTTEPIVDLFAAETAGILAWTIYLVGEQLDLITPMLVQRAAREISQRVLIPALERNDFWWMGFTPDRIVNNWNPWINSNWLVSVLLVEKDEERRLEAVSKILRSLDKFLAVYPEDGGCDEGPSYWGRAGASLFDALELLYNASEGKINVYADPLIGRMGAFICRAHIAEDYYLNFADASAVVWPDAPVIWMYGLRTKQSELASFGSWLAKKVLRTVEGKFVRPGRHSDFSRLLISLFNLKEMEHGTSFPPMPRDVWLPDTQLMAARDQAGSAEGFYLAAKGGHNDESHNHNDVGHFVIYRDGCPVIIDIGVETYSRKTFSEERYNIWTMQSAFHSLPTIDMLMQSAGKQFTARDVYYAADDRQVIFSLDLASAYPAEAGVERWLRRLTLERRQAVLLEDTYDLKTAPKVLSLSFMTPCLVDTHTSGRVVFTPNDLPNGRRSGSMSAFYYARMWNVEVEEIQIDDARLAPVWGKRLSRLVFNLQDPQAHGTWTIKFQ